MTQETYTFRGRSLDEIVPQIVEQLGEDAVIVARRETTSGGVGGFFARREIELEVRPGAATVAAADRFAEQLAEAHERQQDDDAREHRLRPAVSHEVDALPSAADVTVDDLFPAPPPQAQGLAALFNAGLEPGARFARAEQEDAEVVDAEEEEPVVPEADAAAEEPEHPEPPRAVEVAPEPPAFADPALPEPPPYAPEPLAEADAPRIAADSPPAHDAPLWAPEPQFAVEQPTGEFD
jgi:flagellar biosynthesis GTPase FlhF